MQQSVVVRLNSMQSEEALENIENGVKVNGILVKSVWIADDQAMVSKSNAELQRIIEPLNTAV